MRIFLIILLFALGMSAWAQDNIVLENGQNYDASKVLPLIDSLYTGNDQLITFRIKMTDKPDEKSDYFVLSRKGNTFKTFRYNNLTRKLQDLDLSREDYSLLWNTFIQNKLFGIKDEKDISIFCPKKYEIYGSYTYEFLILSNGKMKKLSYYDPEYYDNACYGTPERRLVINAVSAVKYVLNKMR